jgi:hypothetical protein
VERAKAGAVGVDGVQRVHIPEVDREDELPAVRRPRRAIDRLEEPGALVVPEEGDPLPVR